MTEGAPIIELKILGPLMAARDGETLDLGGGKQRAVLAALLLERGGWVPLERLIDRLWGEQPPPSASGTLQAYVSNLRKVLEPGRRGRGYELLVSRARGYELAIPADAVDAWRFERLRAEAAELLAAGQVGAAMRSLEDALNLWRGDALVDLAEEPFAQAEARRLEELRRVATEDRLEAMLALGEQAVVAAEAERLLALDPLRERTWAMLMLAQYRAGRQADALSSYRRARDTLADELGVDPGPALQRLEADILAQAPSLEAPVIGERAQVRVLSDRQPAPVAPPREAIVGRDGEIVGLAMMLSAAAQGDGAVLLVHGEPGIGKTRLVEELDWLARDAGMHVAWGRCVSGLATPPLWPWRQILSTFAAGDADLSMLLPDDADESTTRATVYHAVARALTDHAREQPLVLILDDAHWASEPSIDLLRFVGAATRAAPVLVVVTYRDAEATGPLLDAVASLTREARLERLPLHGLARDAIASFLDEFAVCDPTTELVDALHDRTSGNPFFLRETVRLLQSLGALDAGGHRAVLGVGVPLGVRDVITRRLAVLSDDTTELLSLAAVIGREFDVAVLAGAAEVARDDVLDLLEPAGELGVVSPFEATRFRFSHDLVRETLYDATSPLRRARLHARAGDAILEVRGDDPGSLQALAHHYWEGAAVVGAERAVPYLIRAADQAEGQLAYEITEERLRQALVLLDGLRPAEDVMQLQLRTAARLARYRSMMRGYSSAEAGEALERARALAEMMDAPDELLIALWGLWGFACVRAEFEASHEHARRMLDYGHTFGDERFHVAGHEATGVLALHAGRFDEAVEHLRCSLDVSDTLDRASLREVYQQEPMVTAKSFLAVALAMRGDRDEARRLIDEAKARADRDGEPFSRTFAAWFDAWLCVIEDDPEGARRAAELSHGLAIENGFSQWVAASPIVLGWARAKLGDLEEGERLIREGFKRNEEMGTRMLQPFFRYLLAETLLLAGRRDEAQEELRAGRAHAEACGEGIFDAPIGRLLADSADPSLS